MLSIPVQTDIDSDLQVAGCETWTLNTELKRRIILMSLVLDAFAGSWDTDSMTVSNRRLFHETDSMPITSIVRQRQLRLYGHAARYMEADLAYWVVSEKDNLAWSRPRRRPQNSWLQQIDASCWEPLSMGREPCCCYLYCYYYFFY